MKKSVSGYVLILMVALIPVLLFGTKYLLDLRTLHKVQLEKGNEDWYKRCAKKAALEVAKKWNPGLSLYEQRDAMYKIADDVYNACPLVNNSIIAKAIPGLDVFTKITVKNDGGFNPIQVKLSDYQSRILNKQMETVEYKEETNDKIIGDIDAADRYYSCLIFSQFNAIYRFDNRDLILIRKENGEYEIEDTIEYTMTHSTDEINKQWPKILLRSSNDDALHDSGIPYAGTKKGWIKTTITAPVDKRKNPDDDKVRIEIKNDKIKVTTDKYDVGYAEPAKCNVDIVLGIPVNGAANNVNNLDNNSYPTAGSPYYICDGGTIEYWRPTEEGKKTPISQIGRAFHDFVKKFHYTRGVNVGIVPYCGMVSLPLDRIETWAVDPVNFDRTVFPGNQNEKEYGYIRPCMLYGLFGNGDPLKEGTLSRFNSDYGIDTYSFTNVMVPQGIVKRVPEYGDNLIYYGDILSTNDPAEKVKNYTEYSYSPKFMRRPVYKIPGFAGRFNFLKMGFESTNGAAWSWCNPYHIVEMQSDLLKITSLLNLFYPFNFTSNQLSNFIFVPFVWANNLFQYWSKDTKDDAVDTTDATPSTMTKKTSGRLSAPSKMNEGRKKALILVVNKPDWFEPGELTYLGFDNDYSEIPMIESDCIRGDIDYSDTTKYFADGTKYNTGDNKNSDGTPLIAGAKKILKLSTISGNFVYKSDKGWYETQGANADSSGSATIKLSFPQKYLIKVVVEPIYTWTKNLNPPKDIKTLKYLNGMYMAVTTGPHCRVYTSSDGKAWAQKEDVWPLDQKADACFVFGYNSGNYIHATEALGTISISPNLLEWSNRIIAIGKGAHDSFTLSDRFVINNAMTGAFFYTQDGGITWNNMGNPASKLASKGSIDSAIQGVAYGNGIIIGTTNNGWVSRSYDFGNTWTDPEQLLSNFGNEKIWVSTYGNGKFVAMDENCRVSESYDGIKWSVPELELTGGKTGQCIAYGSEGWVIITWGGGVYRKQGSIKFTNITSTSNQCTLTNTDYKVTEKQEFLIEPSQISDKKDSDGNYTITFTANNLRLIYAEITNRPYKKVTPTVTKNGNTFTLNAKVPFTVGCDKDGSLTYTDINGNSTTVIVSEQNTGRYIHINPKTHKYVKTFNGNGDPVYTVTLSFSGGTLSNPIIGIKCKDSISGLNLEPGKGTQSGHIGNFLTYSKTDNTDLTNQTDNVSISNGRIYCPIGSVLHVKAVPTGKKTMPGSVTFWNDNEIEDNVGQHTVTGSTTFTFRGGQGPDMTAYIETSSSTRGPNFGHNLSLYKVRYSCTNCYISAATLTNQWIRDYEGQYSRGRYGDYKPLILADGMLAKRSPDNTGAEPYMAYWTYDKSLAWCAYNDSDLTMYNRFIKCLSNFRDPCFEFRNIRIVAMDPRLGTNYQNYLGKENDYYCIAYGVEGNSSFYNIGHGDIIWIYLDQNTSPTIDAVVNTEKWSRHDVNLQLNQYVSFNRGATYDDHRWILQTYIKNGIPKISYPTP